MMKTAIESQAKAPLQLRCGKFNNFIAWKEEQLKLCTAEFGFQANIISTNNAYVPAPVTAADYIFTIQSER